jgi:hypothetical protein
MTTFIYIIHLDTKVSPRFHQLAKTKLRDFHPRRAAMVPPAPFQGSTSAVDGSGGGGGSSVTGGLSSVDDIGDITGGTPRA